MTAKEFLDKMASGEFAESIGDCGVCHEPITGVHPDEVRLVDGKKVHDECYFDELSNLVEKFPPGLPRRHPGHAQD